jgi:hypothetical protein
LLLGLIFTVRVIHGLIIILLRYRKAEMAETVLYDASHYKIREKTTVNGRQFSRERHVTPPSRVASFTFVTAPFTLLTAVFVENPRPAVYSVNGAEILPAGG